MMMDQQEKKTEACGFVAGVGAELGFGFVTVQGDNKMVTPNGSSSGRICDDGLVAAVTTTFGTVHKKKRMARQRRVSSSTTTTTIISSNNKSPTLLAAASSSSHVPISPLPSHKPSKTLPPARVSSAI